MAIDMSKRGAGSEELDALSRKRWGDVARQEFEQEETEVTETKKMTKKNKCKN